MKEVERDETTISLDVVYQGKQKEYVRIDQRIMRENDKTTYVIDMEKVPAGLDPARRKNIKFIYQEKYEEEQNNVIWIYEEYRVVIQSNLPEEEIVKIINHIEF